jgi:putative DNA primase/helicase
VSNSPPLVEVLSRLSGMGSLVTRNGQGYMAQCPCHDDKKQSLSVTTNAKGDVLLHDHAGCETTDIVAKISLTMADLFVDGRVKQPGVFVGSGPRGTIVAAYPYTDETGTLQYEAVRFDPKAFRQRRPDGNGGYLWNMQGVTHYLYRLAEFLKKPRTAVYIVEGEKDADALWAHRLPATTNVGGAGKWRPEYTDQLVAAKVERAVIFPDNDEPGRKHAERVATALHAARIAVKIVHLPVVEKGDVSDYLEGHTKAELEEVIKATALFVPVAAPNSDPPRLSPVKAPGEPEPVDLTGYELSDLGNAERLLACYADRIRFCPAIGWLLWDGRRWAALLHAKEGDHLAVRALAAKTIRRFREQCVDIAEKDRAKRAFSHALASEGLSRLNAMVELAKDGVRIEIEELDQDAHLLNVQNGTLDLRAGILRDFDKADYLTRVIPTDYWPEAVAPTWIAFLDTIMAGNANLIGFLQRGVGYSLTGLIRDHVLFLLYGVGANGKSTFLGTIHDVLGEYAQGMAPETIMAKKHEGMPNDIARMRGARFISALETKRGRQLDESLVKKLTGGDLLTGEFKFKEQFDFFPTHKLWLGTNHKPVIKDTTDSIWRRVRLIPFSVVIPQPDQDTALKEKLLAEAPGILAWAIEGCRQWMAGGLTAPPEVVAATEQYRQEQDSLAEFVKLKLEVGPHAWATVADIYRAYEEWANEDGGPEHNGDERLSSRDVTGYLVATYALSRGDKKIDRKTHKALFGIGLRRSPVTVVTVFPMDGINEIPHVSVGTSVTNGDLAQNQVVTKPPGELL